MDDIENQLPKLFETAASHLEPPIEDIVRVSTQLGRRRRARRNTGVVAAAVGVVGLAAGVAFGVQRFAIGSVPSGTTAAGQSTADHSASVLATPRLSAPDTTTAASDASTASGTTAVVPQASTLVSSTPTSGPQVGKWLLSQLVSGYGLQTVRENDTSIGVADIIYNDGRGQSEIMASVRAYSAALKSSNAYTCTNFSTTDEAQRPSGVPTPSCTKLITTDGHIEYVMVTGNDGSGFYDYEVNLFTADNMVVSIDAGNGVPQGATVDVTRALPPLTLAEMQVMVADPAWLDYIDPAS